MGIFSKVVGTMTGKRKTEQGQEVMRQGYADARETMEPYTAFGDKYGIQGIQQLQDNPNQITQLPFYQFMLDQGTGAITRKSNAAGKYFSGETATDLMEYGQNLAKTSYADEFNRRFGIAQLGQQAAADVASLHANEGRDVGGIFAQRGFNERGYVHDVGMSFLNKGMSSGGGGGGGMFCWVAEELYGEDSAKTHVLRSFVSNHQEDVSELGSFIRAYRDNGRKWAEQIKEFPELRRHATKVWDSLYEEATRENN